jgi:DNA-binding CsgD family transcriptional regulator
MLAEGKSMNQTAYIPKISCRTVRFHQYRIMEGLKFTANGQLVQYAIKQAIILPQ